MQGEKDERDALDGDMRLGVILPGVIMPGVRPSASNSSSGAYWTCKRIRSNSVRAV